MPSKHWPAVIAATGLTLADLAPDEPSSRRRPPGATRACWCWRTGPSFWGRGFGAHAAARVGEVCFNTGMTGYQETLTDPSYAGQLITFTFPHIGNVGATPEDNEATNVAALGLIVKQDVTEPSQLARALAARRRGCGRNDVPGIAGVDTRALTLRIRDGGAPNGILAYPADGRFDLAALQAQAAAWPGLEGMDLARQVSCTQTYSWTERHLGLARPPRPPEPRHHVVAVDYGAKRNILRCLAAAGCRVTVVPATATRRRHPPPRA